MSKICGKYEWELRDAEGNLIGIGEDLLRFDLEEGEDFLVGSPDFPTPISIKDGQTFELTQTFKSTGKNPKEEGGIMANEIPFEPEYYSGLNWRKAEKLVGEKVEVSVTGDIWFGPFVLQKIEQKAQVCHRFWVNDTWQTYIRTCPETHAHPTHKKFKLHDTVMVYDRYRFAIPLKAEIVEFSQVNDGVRLLLHESNHKDYQKGCSTVWVHEAQIRKIDSSDTNTHSTVTLTVNGQEWVLPKPETEAPNRGTIVFTWRPDKVSEWEWDDFGSDYEILRAGRVHRTESRAQAWADFWREAIIGAIK